jgi:diguanylate cyclase (GGDEF)-like protein
LDNLLEKWKSSHELINVRRERQILICQGLSLSGSLFLLVFGILSVVEERFIMGALLLGAMSIGLVNAYILKISDKVDRSVFVLNGIIFLSTFILVYTGGIDNTSTLWIYPLFAITLFINRFWFAAAISGSFILLLVLFLLTPLSQILLVDYSQVFAIRFILTLLALSAICLVALYYGEYAYKLVLKLHDNEIHKVAFYDSLTGLPNRWSFQQNFARILEQRHKNRFIALLYIDLDNFKFVNDNYGHDVGDKLLIHFGKRLRQSVRVDTTDEDLAIALNDDIARLAGDEFVVILKELECPQDAEIVAKRILNLFQGGYNVDGNVYPVYASLGISVCPYDTSTATDLVRYADAAMYKAKREGNNNFQFFNEQIANELSVRQNIETGLKKAVEQQDFSLVYQPIFSGETKEIVAIETLLRCHSAELVDYGPDVFIPVAESIGLIKILDEWVLNNAIKDFTLIREATGFEGKLSINISGVELLDENFPQKVKAIVESYDLPCSLIDIEVTETALVPDNPIVIKVLNEFASKGFSLSLDDFGTGYTSFNQLILYPATNLKIDRSFINDLFSDDESLAKVVKTIHDLAKIYQLNVIAEGVETQQQLEYLQNIGCECVQGYFLAHPVDKMGLIELLTTTH